MVACRLEIIFGYSIESNCLHMRINVYSYFTQSHTHIFSRIVHNPNNLINESNRLYTYTSTDAERPKVVADLVKWITLGSSLFVRTSSLLLLLLLLLLPPRGRPENDGDWNTKWERHRAREQLLLVLLLLLLLLVLLLIVCAHVVCVHPRYSTRYSSSNSHKFSAIVDEIK